MLTTTSQNAAGADMGLDIAAIQAAFSTMKSTWYLPLLLSVLLIAGLFFLNFKKKNGFVYMAVAFIAVGLLLLPLKSGAMYLTELFVPAYASLLEPLLTDVLQGFQTFAIIYLVIGAVCIVLQIVIPKVCREKVTPGGAGAPAENPEEKL